MLPPAHTTIVIFILETKPDHDDNNFDYHDNDADTFDESYNDDDNSLFGGFLLGRLVRVQVESVEHCKRLLGVPVLSITMVIV